MTQTISVRRLHLEYRLWTAELDFDKEMLGIFESNLEEIADRNTVPEVLASVEHFQNQFILQKEQIDILKHKLHISEKQLAAMSKDRSEVGILNLRLDNHTELRQEFIRFREIFEDLRKEFHAFESKVL